MTGTATKTDFNGGVGTAPESYSWSNSVSGQVQIQSQSGATLGINALIASLTATFGGSLTNSFTTSGGTTLTDTVETPSGDWAYFQVGYHSEWGSGVVKSVTPTCATFDSGTWVGLRVPFDPVETGICGWITGKTSSVCATPERA